MSNLEQLIAQQNLLLFRIADSLDAINGKQQLGFGVSPRPTYVYCNRSKGFLWYTLSNDSEREPVEITHTALTGYIQKLEFKKVERRGKETWKLHLHVKADRLYILESGFDSLFSKDVLAALASLTPEQIKQLITIEVQAGESDEVLFSRLYSQGELVYAPFGEDSDWKTIATTAKQIVNNHASQPNH